MAFLAPRRDLRRANCALRYEFLVRIAPHAALISDVFSHGAPLRILRERCLPALSSSLGHRPAHEIRWLAVGKRLISSPISPASTRAVVSFTPGIGVRF